MLKNYFKIAIAVLKRRKFFTFISLFGISFTLTILIVMTAFIDRIVNDPYPDRKRDRSLYINGLEERGNDNMNSSPLSYYFLEHYAGSLKTPVALAISSGYSSTNTYVNDRKIVINYKYTNAAYWDVLDHDFLEGKPYTAQQVLNGELVAVISEDTKKDYFGDVPSVVGKYIEADNVKYRVTGVVKDIPTTSYFLYSDIYLPYTVSKGDYKSKSYHGQYTGILLARSADDVPKMKAEFDQVMSRVSPEDKSFTRLVCSASTYLRSYVATGGEDRTGFLISLGVVSLFVLLIMLLPALNLVNINITRIMERSSEIGVRKAFGASSRTLVYQFIVENLILTLLGGLIGIVLSVVVLQVLNYATLIPHLNLSINLTVLSYALGACLFFGLLSGVYPAWRMSRLNVVSALKNNS